MTSTLDVPWFIAQFPALAPTLFSARSALQNSDTSLFEFGHCIPMSSLHLCIFPLIVFSGIIFSAQFSRFRIHLKKKTLLI